MTALWIIAIATAAQTFWFIKRDRAHDILEHNASSMRAHVKNLQDERERLNTLLGLALKRVGEESKDE